jgi:hypothetical protein
MRDANAMAHSDPHRDKSTTPKRRPRVRREVLSALLSGASRQLDSLPESSPRKTATLPVLRFMARADDGGR